MKTALKFGLLAGAALILWDALLYNFLYVQVGIFALVLQVLIVGSAIFFGIKDQSKEKYNGEISYKNASLTGFLITIYTAVLYTAAVYMFYPYGNEGFVNEFKQLTETKIKEQDPKADTGKILLEVEKMLTPQAMAQAAFLNTVIFGVIFSLVFASVLRKRTPPIDFK